MSERGSSVASKLELYSDSRSQFRWKAGNGEVIASSRWSRQPQDGAGNP
jgi:hypothetical protein